VYVRGIYSYYHDSAAVLIKNGNIVAAAQEERGFTRKKHDDDFPWMSAEYCLKEAGINIAQIEHVVFYGKTILEIDYDLTTVDNNKSVELWLWSVA